MDYLKTAGLSETEARKAHAYLAGHKLFSAYGTHYAYIKPNGTVAASGIGDLYNNCNQCGVDNESKWNNIISVAAGDNHTVGLKSDGSVVATNFAKDYLYKGTRIPNYYSGQCDVDYWNDIIAISSGYGHTLGLKKDGSVVAAGYMDEPECDVSAWRDIVIVSAGWSHSVGLKKDGTVVATGANKDGECNVSNWSNIVDVVAVSSVTYGLKSDGTVIAAGAYSEDEWCNGISRWNNIVQIAAVTNFVAGLRADGTVIVSTKNSNADVEKFRILKDVVSLSLGCENIICVKRDGRIFNLNISGNWSFDASKIRLFNDIETWEQDKAEATEEWNKKANYRTQNVCQYCGGKFKGLFSKVCTSCGQKKDY